MRQNSLKDGRRNMVRIGELISLTTLLAAYCLASAAQSANTASLVPATSQFLAAEVSVPGKIADLVVREIDDPLLGTRWLLMRDRNHPAGPGRLVLIATANRQTGQSETGDANSLVAKEMILARPIIRAGDRLIVEENTAVIEARLEAVALGPAMLGSAFDVRLRLGGKVARAVALAPGRAVFQAQAEARP